MGKTPTEEDIARVRRISKLLAPELARCVLPIFRRDDIGMHRSMGSGFLASNDGVLFLVSAAHVFDYLAEKKPLFIYGGENKLHELGGELWLSKPAADRKNDPLDVGVLKLLPEVLPSYSDKQAVPIDVFLPSALPRAGKQYLLVGFPASKTKKYVPDVVMRAEPFLDWQRSASLEEYRSIGRREEDHIVVPFDREEVTWVDGSTGRTFPAVNGMSGSPLWIYEGGGERDGDRARVRIVGVFHWYDKELMVSTDIKVALDMIAKMSV
jgi:hypothetical protein